MFNSKIILTIFIACAFGYAVHGLYGQVWVQNFLNQAASTGTFDNLIKPPYPAYIMVVSALTALIPTTIKVVAYYYCGHVLPFQSRVANGVLFGLVLIGFSGELIRMPIMSVVIGNPAYVMLAQSAEPWIIGIGTGVIIALLVVPKRNSC